MLKLLAPILGNQYPTAGAHDQESPHRLYRPFRGLGKNYDHRDQYQHQHNPITPTISASLSPVSSGGVNRVIGASCKGLRIRTVVTPEFLHFYSEVASTPTHIGPVIRLWASMDHRRLNRKAVVTPNNASFTFVALSHATMLFVPFLSTRLMIP